MFLCIFEIFSFKKVELNREVIVRIKHKLERSADYYDCSRPPVFSYADKLRKKIKTLNLKDISLYVWRFNFAVKSKTRSLLLLCF